MVPGGTMEAAPRSAFICQLEMQMADAANPDAIALLKADHRKVEELFASFEAARGAGKKKALAEQICMELTIHTKIEEDIFYPACEGAVDEDLLKEAHVEHDGAKVLIAEIEAGGAGDDFYDAKVKVLSEMIEHHVGEEEKRVDGMFSQARAAGLDMDSLGEKMAAEKQQLMAAYKDGGLPTPETPTLQGTTLR
jgi:hemerythrin superfamily protein